MLDKPDEARGASRDPHHRLDQRRPLKSLDHLYLRQSQWSELADIIGAAARLAADEETTATLQLRLADLRETKMSEIESAIEIYRDVLERDLNNAAALAALERLIQLEPTASPSP